MKLTGKCLEEFEEWFLKDVQEEDGGDYKGYLLRSFYSKGEAMQYGVLVDYFDSVGLHIKIEPFYDRMLNYNRGYDAFIIGDNIFNNEIFIENNDCFYTRPEARKAAIKKANEIRNEQLNK